VVREVSAATAAAAALWRSNLLPMAAACMRLIEI